MSARPEITRRTFVGATAAAFGGIALGDPVVDAARRAVSRRRPPAAVGGAFRQSVASGQPSTNAVTLWTRLEELERTSRLQVEISPDADFRRVIHRRTVLARASEDFTVHHRATTQALAPGEEYFFRFFTCDETSPIGRFRTARPPDSRQPIRIGFFSCQNYAAGYYPALAGLAREPDLDLVICLGDYIYEQTGRDAIPDRRDRTGANRDSEVQTLPEYRDKYRLYHTDKNLRAVRERFPLLAIWDDHESENNNAGARPAELPEKQNTSVRRVPYLTRRANAYRAFFEQMPRIRVKGDPTRIYGTVPLGSNADLLLLDERQYRDLPPCEGRTEEPCPSAETNAPRTMLGSAQKAWFKSALASSRASWKVVANQVMIMALDVPARTTQNPDQWDGYAAERREILEFVQARGITDVTFLTGDIHTFFAGNVTPSGREGSPAIDGTPAATEFVGGSITSPGLEEDVPTDGPVSGPLSEPAVRANNPHIVHANLSKRGYGVLEARPEELRVAFRAVESALVPTSPVSTLATFRVPRGTPRVERLS